MGAAREALIKRFTNHKSRWANPRLKPIYVSLWNRFQRDATALSLGSTGLCPQTPTLLRCSQAVRVAKKPRELRTRERSPRSVLSDTRLPPGRASALPAGPFPQQVSAGPRGGRTGGLPPASRGDPWRAGAAGRGLPRGRGREGERRCSAPRPPSRTAPGRGAAARAATFPERCAGVLGALGSRRFPPSRREGAGAGGRPGTCGPGRVLRGRIPRAGGSALLPPPAALLQHTAAGQRPARGSGTLFSLGSAPCGVWKIIPQIT